MKQNSNTMVIVPALLEIESNIANITRSAKTRIRQDEQPPNLCNCGQFRAEQASSAITTSIPFLATIRGESSSCAADPDYGLLFVVYAT